MRMLWAHPDGRDPFPMEERYGYVVSIITRPGDPHPSQYMSRREFIDRKYHKSPGVTLDSARQKDPSSLAAMEFYRDRAGQTAVLVYDGVYSGKTHEFLGFHAGALTIFNHPDEEDIEDEEV